MSKRRFDEASGGRGKQGKISPDATEGDASFDGAAAASAATATAGTGAGAGAGTASSGPASSPRLVDGHKVVSQAEWLEARKKLLAEEKEFSKMKDELARKRREEMPMTAVDKDYEFRGADGPTTLSALFGDKEDLIVVHFMFDNAWDKGCSSCSLWADGYTGTVAHVQRKAAFVVVVHAEYEKMAEFMKWKGWSFPAVSSAGSTFNRDFGVSFTPDEISSGAGVFNYGRPFPASEGPGYSIFHKGSDGVVYHTYSTYARGMELMSPVWGFLDMLPKGRDEKRGMDWLKHQQEY